MSSPCPEFAVLEAHAGGRASPDESAVTASHASSCAACADALARLLADLAIEARVRALFAPSAPPRERIEGFRILRELGRGGMGVVFEAEQIAPPRRVALKVVRGAGWVDEGTLQLFQREIRALARLEHPGIAPLYDAGSTTDGEHWFAMELVRGEPLARRAAPLPLDAKLALFRQLCDAIDYAHQRGVVHRDLKPSNVLVDERGQVKVLDFGLAKITDQDVAATTVLSEPGAIRGTLAYMSPEQARGDPSAIDQRSDVYSLGAMLYELLTARVPSDVSGVHVHEAARRICEEAPERPSRIDASLRGELETIVLKALEKEPDRRYPSAAALGEDLRRHLADEPILARPPSGLYHARKLVARHRLAASMLAAVFVLALGTAAWTSVLYGREAALRAEADDARGKADREAELARVRALTAEKTKDFVVGVFRAGDVELGDQRDPPASTLLARGLADVDAKLRDEPVVRAELLETFGTVYTHLGRYAEARPVLEEAVLLRRAQGEVARAELAGALEALGRLRVRLGEAREAVPLHEEALLLRLATAGDAAEPTTRSRVELGSAARAAGDVARAEAIYREALAAERARGAAEDSEGVLTTQHELAGVLIRMQRNAEARELMERVVAGLRVRFPRSLRLCSSLSSLAITCAYLGDHARAEDLYLEAIDLRTELVGPDNPSVATVLVNLAYLYLETRRTDQALDVLERARDVFARTHGERNPAYADVLHALARVRSARGEAGESERLIRECIEVRAAALDPDHPDLAEAHVHLGRVLLAGRRFEPAREAFETAAGAFERRLGPTNLRTLGARVHVGACEVSLQRWDDAVRTLEPALEGMRACREAAAVDRRNTAGLLAQAQRGAGRAEEAARVDELAKTFVDPPRAEAP